MVYDQNNNADFDKADSDYNDDDEYGQIKLNDETYHEKIRAAINTKLNHKETFHLRMIALLLLIVLIGITIVQMIITPLCLSIAS